MNISHQLQWILHINYHEYLNNTSGSSGKMSGKIIVFSVTREMREIVHVCPIRFQHKFQSERWRFSSSSPFQMSWYRTKSYVNSSRSPGVTSTNMEVEMVDALSVTSFSCLDAYLIATLFVPNLLFWLLRFSTSDCYDFLILMLRFVLRIYGYNYLDTSHTFVQNHISITKNRTITSK